MRGRSLSLLLLGTIAGLGWLAAAGAGVAVWEQAAAIAALGMVIYRASRSETRPALGWREALALAVAAMGLALGWVWPAALAAALAAGPHGQDLLSRRRLALWALLAVPWLAADASLLGWFFRSTGTWAAAGIFQLLGFAVVRQGTWLRVEDLPLTVDAACAGIDTLQSTLVAGLWLMESLKSMRGWVAGVALLPLLAWLANTLRIVVLGAVALTAGFEAASGWFHLWGGLTVIVGVCAFAAVWSNWLGRWEAKR